ncbi:MAG: hypothetical protein ACRDTP_01110, partial [Mycobacteriales bacterium]
LPILAVTGAAALLAGCGGSSSGAASTSPADTPASTTRAAPTPSGTPDPDCHAPTSTPATAASYAATRLFSLSWLTITAQLSLAQPLLSTRYFPTYQTEIQNLQSRYLSTKTVSTFAVTSVTYVSGDCTVPVYRVVGVQTSKRGSDPAATSTITLKEAMLLQGASYVVDDVQSGT